MINHARTLLLNIDGDKRPAASFFGEEFVEPTFRAVQLDSSLLNARRALFGSDPDNAGLNLLLKAYTTLLDSTEFVAFVEALDTRITYRTNKTLLTEPYGVDVSGDADALDFTGVPVLGDKDGRLKASWMIERTSPSVFRIIDLRTSRFQDHAITFTDGISEFVPMTGQSDYLVRFVLANIVGDTWVVSFLGTPQPILDPVERLAQFAGLSAESLAAIFPVRAPFNTFKELFEKHAHLPYKLSGALLAVIYRTEELRVGA